MSNNETVARLQADCVFRLVKYFSFHPSLPLAVTPVELLLGPEVVYSNPDKTDNLASQLYREGIRNIIFYPEVQNGELLEFVNIINQETGGRERSADDIVTLMWEKSFDHIEYVVVEEASMASRDKTLKELLESPTLTGKGSPTQFHADLKLTPKDMTPPVTFPLHKIILSDEEVERLEKEIELDDPDLLYQGALDILLELIYRGFQPAGEASLVGIVEGMFDSLYENGQLRSLRMSFYRLYELLAGPFIGSTELTRLKEKLTDGFSSPRKVALFKNILNLKCHASPGDVGAFISTLLPSAVPYLIAILPEIVHSSYRRALCDFLAKQGGAYIDDIGMLTTNEHTYVVRDAVYILGRVKDQRATAHLSKTIKHNNREIRIESVGALSYHRGPHAEQLLLHALLDQDVDVRTAALRTIVGMGSNRVLDSLIEFVESEDFKAKEVNEKKRFFLALARLGGPLLVPYFRELLLKRKLFERSFDTEIKICAAAGLAAVGNVQAKESLEEAAKSTGGAVKEKVLEILRTLRPTNGNPLR